MTLRADALKSLPVAGALLSLAALAALGLAYWGSVVDRQHYLQSRNFRLLAVLASQTENLIDNRARIFRDAMAAAAAPSEDSTLKDWLAGAVSSLREANLLDPAIESPAAAPSEVQAALPGYRPSVTGDGAALRIAFRPPDPKTLPAVSMRVPAAAVLDGIFTPKLRQGAFDTLVLATPSGRVVYAAGRRANEMHAMTLAALVPALSTAAGPGFAPVARSIAEHRVTMAGVEYRMFVQPCCRNDESAAASADSAGDGLVVVGLTEVEAMRSASLAISPVLVLAGVAFVLAALVSWAFLKVALINAEQRVTSMDVLQLGASTVFGLALATILLLTAGAYARFSADVDGQLRRLADRLHERLSTEMDGAYRQATAMTAHLRAAPCLPAATAAARLEPDRDRPNPCESEATRMAGQFSADGQPYRTFTTFALIDVTGFQLVKVVNDPATARRIKVADRDYFQAAKAEGASWALPQCPRGCVLESLWSWTTGAPQVVLSTPTGLDALPVAALAIPIRPLIDPILPPGFEFAVVDGTGRVHFHSDTQRNVHENLLLETDQNPRLRSMMGTQSAGTVNTSYWGRPYRAYVRPTAVPGWSIVSLFDKQHSRALVLEWSALSLLLQSAFMVLWVSVMLVALARGASWLWPDPLRRPRYRGLAALYAGALVLWLAVARFAEVGTALYAGVAMPVALWVVTYVVLARRPPGVERVEGWSELHRDYRVTGALFLALTAAVPGAAFFAYSYDVHIEGYLKHRQIALARAVDARARCASASPADVAIATIRYDDVFYGSHVRCVPASLALSSSGGAPSSAAAHVVHAAVEDYLPYYTSASVDLRELRHARSEDGTWSSRREKAGQLAVDVAARTPGYRLEALTPIPPLVAVRALADDARLVWMALVAVLLLGGIGVCAYWVVGYLLRRVLLSDVVEPVWAKGRLVATVGQHLLMTCEDPDGMADQLTGAFILRVTPIVTSASPAVEWRKARVAIGEAGPGRAIVIPDVDEARDQVEVMHAKMCLIEELAADPVQTVVLLSRFSPQVLAASVWGASENQTNAERWQELFSRFVPVDRRESPETVRGAYVVTVDPAPSGWRHRLTHMMSRWVGVERPTGWRHALLVEEGRPNRALRRICADLYESEAFQSGSLTYEQILDEVEERAAPIYRREWQNCTSEERVVLEHIAQHGLANAACRRVVRRLLVKGLLRKDPDLRLMNQTFQRFVLGPDRRREVMRLEGAAEPSLWDRLRVPLGLGATGALVFLVMTQREAFDATVTVAAGVTTAVPTLLRLTSMLAQLGQKGPAEPKVNG